MHTNQTVDFVREKIAKWTKFDKAEMTVMEALRKLNDIVDESDPDVDVSIKSTRSIGRLMVVYLLAAIQGSRAIMS